MDRIASLRAQIEKTDRETRRKREKLAELEKKRLATDTTQARKRDTRAKIIAGAIFIKGIKDGASPVQDTLSPAQLLRFLDAGLTGVRDRELFATIFPELGKGVAGQATASERTPSE